MQQTLSDHAALAKGNNPGNLLRNTLLVNGAFSTLSGLLLIFDSGMVDNFLGLGAQNVILVLGIGLLLFAAEVLWVATCPQINHKAVQLITILDVLWVAASVAILAVGVPALHNAGWWAVAVVADIIALFAIFEFVGLRRMKATV